MLEFVRTTQFAELDLDVLSIDKPSFTNIVFACVKLLDCVTALPIITTEDCPQVPMLQIIAAKINKHFFIMANFTRFPLGQGVGS